MNFVMQLFNFCLPSVLSVLRIIDIWEKSSIPHLNNNSVYKKVTRLIENIEKLKKRQHQGTFKTVIEKLKIKLDSLLIYVLVFVYIYLCVLDTIELLLLKKNS